MILCLVQLELWVQDYSTHAYNLFKNVWSKVLTCKTMPASTIIAIVIVENCDGNNSAITQDFELVSQIFGCLQCAKLLTASDQRLELVITGLYVSHVVFIQT